MKGRAVTILEMRADVAVDANPRHRPALLAQLAAHTDVRTGLRAVEITTAGLRPLRETVDALRGTAPIVEVIGDCVKPDIIRGATWRAYHAALDL